MKTLIRSTVSVLCVWAWLLSAAAQPAQDNSPPPANPSPAPTAPVPPASPATHAPVRPGPAASPQSASTNDVPFSETKTAGAGGLRLNFRNAPLDMVLKYLSDAAGFVIVMDTPVHGNVSVISSQPMTKDQAVALLNSALSQNGYAAIRNGQTLTIVSQSDAKLRNIPVITGNDPKAIPNTDQIVTQIIPVRYVQAKQLVSDLAPFVSPQATIVANEAGNSIVITDTQAHIKHLVEIIEAVDSGAQGETEIRVFPLKYANPSDVADELGQIFPSSGTGTSQNQLPVRFRGGFFARMMAAQAANNNQSPAMQKQSQVIAVADARTQSVIVSAAQDLMSQIAGMIQQLDVPSSRDQHVYVYHMDNGDPQQALQVLQSMFQSSTTTRGTTTSGSAASQTSALQARENQNAASMGSSSSSGTSILGGGNNRRSAGGRQLF